MKYLLIVVLFLLTACKSALVSNEPSSNEAVSERETPYREYSDIFEDDDEEDESADDPNQAYFFDSLGQRFYVNYGSSSRLDSVVAQTLDNLLIAARKRYANLPEYLNVVLEVESPSQFRGDIVAAAEENLVSKSPFISLQSQEVESREIVSKIIQRELDPFYSSSYDSFDLEAQVSDLIIYIRAETTDEMLEIKMSILSKASTVIAVDRSSIPISTNTSTSKSYVSVTVPESDPSRYKVFDVMRYAVNERQLRGIGSVSNSSVNMSYSQANAYCEEQSLRLTSPYVFEFARRDGEISPPTGGASEEIIAALDEEDFDSPFFREGKDHLSPDDEQDNTYLLFDWDTELYSIVAKSYKSTATSFRCFKR